MVYEVYERIGPGLSPDKSKVRDGYSQLRTKSPDLSYLIDAIGVSHVPFLIHIIHACSFYGPWTTIDLCLQKPVLLVANIDQSILVIVSNFIVSTHR